MHFSRHVARGALSACEVGNATHTRKPLAYPPGAERAHTVLTRRTFNSSEGELLRPYYPHWSGTGQQGEIREPFRGLGSRNIWHFHRLLLAGWAERCVMESSVRIVTLKCKGSLNIPWVLVGFKARLHLKCSTPPILGFQGIVLAMSDWTIIMPRLS